ncbi:polyketide synthase-like protein [Xylaria acuta]|nr:polyketide synthase-like protein [Xylaria acuta]
MENGTAERNGFSGAGLHGVGELSQSSPPCLDEKVNTASDTEDPICIVGMACRLPGGVDSPARFWEFLVNKQAGQGRVPPDRFNIKGYYKAGTDQAGVLNADGGYFINEDLRQFENSFFGINSLEATYMDPQQRKLLEVVYECFENAGVSMDLVSGTNTGVYVGSFTMDYSIQQGRDSDYAHRYSATGISSTIVSNRISHVFNLQGPSLTLDTACSSSMYAFHLAVSAIKAGECDGAIVAGVNLIRSPEQHYMIHKAGVLSPTSTCHTFDASADGYGRGDGVNAVYVKRLSNALKEKDHIWAVVRSTAVNADGRTPGITQPSADLQSVLIRKTYATAGLNPIETDYFECHGTGTAVGDPTEIKSIAQVFPPRERGPLLIGSVKTNFGHSEAAAGLTSIIKVSLAFQHAKVPPTYGVTKVNPSLQLDSRNMKVVTEVSPWPSFTRRSSINSFGYGGANAHTILESLDSYLGRHGVRSMLNTPLAPAGQVFVLPISSASPKSLDARVDSIREAIPGSSDQTLERLAYTLAHRREHFQARDFLLAQIKADGTAELIARGDSRLPPTSPLPFHFIFTGQGAQYPRMARELFLHNKAFITTIRNSDAVLRNLPPSMAPTWTLEQILIGKDDTEADVHEVTRSQSLCTAIQIGIVAILRTWGISPSTVVGHSSGEIAAAYAAGFIDLRQATLVAYFRGYAVAKIQSEGSMMAASITVDAAQELIRSHELEDKVCIACVNAPESVTLSGSIESVDVLFQDLKGQNRFARKLRTGGRAYHSHIVAEVGQLYEDLLRPLFTSPIHKQSLAHMFSSVGYYGDKLIDPRVTTDMAKYWRDNLEKPVQFQLALTKLAIRDDGCLIEIGPHQTLKGPINQTLATLDLEKRRFPYFPTLLRGANAHLSMQTLAGKLFSLGYEIEWQNINDISEENRVPAHNLSPYPWDYSNGLLWHEPRSSIDVRNRQHLRHKLLGTLQLTGNGIDKGWRNVLRLSEVPWLRDHRVESQIVFPATGYLVLAMEALSQNRGFDAEVKPSFEFRNVHIKTAFVLHEEEDDPNEVEIHTGISPARLSAAATSSKWFDFSVSSWVGDQETLHCMGTVQMTEQLLFGNLVKIKDDVGLETCPLKPWYDILREGGVNWGPHFQQLNSLRVDGDGIKAEAIATSKVGHAMAQDTHTDFAIHPITLDACLQAILMANARTNSEQPPGYLPVCISECRIRSVGDMRSNFNSLDCEYEMHARSRKTGVATLRADCTLYDTHGVPLVDFQNVRFESYRVQATDENGSSLQRNRQPGLRMKWKPDVSRLRPDTAHYLVDYLSSSLPTQLISGIPPEENVPAIIGALLDLAGHRNASMEVLEITRGCSNESDQWLRFLGKEEALPRYKYWNTASFDNDGNLIIDSGRDEPFDVVVLADDAFGAQYWRHNAETLLSVVKGSGLVITNSSDAAQHALHEAGFSVIGVGPRIFIAARPHPTSLVEGKDVLLLCREEPSPAAAELAISLSAYLKETACAARVRQVSLADLHKYELTDDIAYVSLLELDHELLATISQPELERLQAVTNVARHMLWLTGANAFHEPNPNLALSNGLSRALMLEQPLLHFSVLDVGSIENTHSMQLICESILSALHSCFNREDSEFVLANGLLYISRLVSDIEFNTTLRRRLRFQDPVQHCSLAEASPARLQIGTPGVTTTLHFQMENVGEPPAGYVDVETKAFGLNAKDVYAMAGRVETRNATTGLEFSGVVKTVGSSGDDHGLNPGDKVVVMAPCHLSTINRVPVWSVHKMLAGEDFVTVASLTVSYATALFALYDRANLRPGESILIHSGAGALGIAAIRIAQRIGATIFTTVSTEAKRSFLQQSLGVPSSHIFHSRNDEFVEDVKNVTGGKGVNVVLNSLTGDLLHASWRCIAPFGRFVEIGKRDLIDAGKLDMDVFLRGSTFTAFDLSELFFQEDQYYRDILASKIDEVLALFRAGEIEQLPITTFDVSNISHAYRHLSSRDHIGKVVVSFEDPNAQIPVSPLQYSTILHPNKSYLMIGCLGGLGRSLSRWMMSRGARNFVFLGRTGADKPAARKFITEIQTKGIRVAVIRGNVTHADDVAVAMAACETEGFVLGGIVQAAMSLDEALFTDMTSEAWHKVVQPKWKGTWNLHNHLEGRDKSLDFLLLMSSVNGTVSWATESNYGAANVFLDAFAHWSRRQGKPTVAVGLGMVSEVGYIHENPHIESLLLRRGLVGLKEKEFLQIVDLVLCSIRQKQNEAANLADPGASTIITGLELEGTYQLIDQGFEVTPAFGEDPRASLLLAAFKARQEARQAASCGALVDGEHQARLEAAWWGEVPPNAAEIFTPHADAPTLRDAALRLVRKQFSNLLLMPLENIDDHKPMAEVGIDSMIASEFRAWLWKSFKVDITLLDVLGPKFTIDALTTKVEVGLGKNRHVDGL